MTSWLNTKVAENFNFDRRYPETQLLGLELEFEGRSIANNVAPGALGGAWRVMADGSLRGEAFEVVSTGPYSLKDSLVNLTELYSVILRGKAVINDSMRAGVHVHVNCQDLTLRQLFTFMAAYYCLEDLLVEDLGEERAGNLFCLRLSDAEDISFGVQNCLNRRTLSTHYFTSEGLRYAAMNLVSLSKFGTLEFRALRTPLTPEPVARWISLLEELFTNSKKIENPRTLITSMSANGEKEVVGLLLPTFAKELFAKPHFEQTVYNSIRNIQTWAYLTDWS